MPQLSDSMSPEQATHSTTVNLERKEDKQTLLGMIQGKVLVNHLDLGVTLSPWGHFRPAGRWNKYLAKFVNSLCKHLNKRLAREASAHTHPGNAVANGHSSQDRQQLSTAAQRCLARLILRMADKAQYSKVWVHWADVKTVGKGAIGLMLRQLARV